MFALEWSESHDDTLVSLATFCSVRAIYRTDLGYRPGNTQAPESHRNSHIFSSSLRRNYERLKPGKETLSNANTYDYDFT